MDLMSVLQETQEVVRQAKLDDDLRAIAFSKAFDVLVLSGQNPDAPERQDRPAIENTGDAQPKGLSRVAQRMGVPLAHLEEIFYEEGGDLCVSIPSSRLAQEKRAGARQLALLIASGRQAGGFDESGWTSSEVIRQWCDHYGKFDSSNFAWTLSKMDDVFHVRGKGQKKEFRLKQLGYERAAELMREIGVDETGR